MAVTTVTANVNVAKYLKNKADSTYLVLGRERTAWEKETNPPEPDRTVSQLSEIVGYKKMDKVMLVAPVSKQTANSIEFDGIYWEPVSDDEAVSRQATFVYYECQLEPEDFKSRIYRQVGVQTGVVPDDALKGQRLLNPEDVKTIGDLEFYENRVPQERGDTVRILERFIVSTMIDNTSFKTDKK